MIKVILVEDNFYVREVLKQMIAGDSRFQILATTDDAFEAEKLCAEHSPDLVLMDVQTAGNHSGLAAGRRIKKNFPDTKIVIVTSLVDAEVLAEAKNGCADSLWYKDYGTKDVLDVMIRTAGGERVFPLNSPNVTLKDIFSDDLTEKQMKILRCFVKGYTYAETAEELGMSLQNVRWHLDRIVEKGNFENKHELLMTILDSKLIVTNLLDED
ncbi:MAG: response regulator transcription factor [Clostridia bacterium]|nr:response regulator transcription factor [Clostridia bacterium]MBQ9482440.1 response regulator transcription factor [Clostridia bacterium]